MKLTAEEQKSLLDLVKKFSTIDKDLQKMENLLNGLDETRIKILTEMKDLKERANSLRQEEDALTQELINKYGAFHLNMETFEIEPA